MKNEKKSKKTELKIYTTPSCSSCRKAKKWLDSFGIKYDEVNILAGEVQMSDIDLMLSLADDGFDSIISTRSKTARNDFFDLDSFTTHELKRWILANPAILKRPIIIENEKMQVGYNDEEIRIFIPKDIRAKIMESPDFECDDYIKEISIKEVPNEKTQEIPTIKLEVADFSEVSI